jgi:hypothetical protein
MAIAQGLYPRVIALLLKKVTLLDSNDNAVAKRTLNRTEERTVATRVTINEDLDRGPSSTVCESPARVGGPKIVVDIKMNFGEGDRRQAVQHATSGGGCGRTFCLAADGCSEHGCPSGRGQRQEQGRIAQKYPVR